MEDLKEVLKNQITGLLSEYDSLDSSNPRKELVSQDLEHKCKILDAINGEGELSFELRQEIRSCKDTIVKLYAQIIKSDRFPNVKARKEVLKFFNSEYVDWLEENIN